ncbi:unnamed protein product [Didymodactylos carnosus]|uniref:NAD(P)(+)--arginine ADP-ribosyltransferase n=1 Tax=Didymodactylos carnosus TaxID=1234261 RepID=A0A8S2H7U1_9BILA|nr:unnamed protein product [Didymodactylos carnosus]CAF3613099.1 unnamed protein product [Didymodactylos carnosus]
MYTTALSRLPPARHFLFRGVKEDLRADFSKGKTVIWWGFSSCTSSVEVLENEQFFGTTGTRTLFNVECDTGKDISRHSFYQTEDEILLPPARQFKVLSCLDSGNGLHIVQLKETEPPFPLLEPVPVPNPSVKPKEHFSSSSSLKTEHTKSASKAESKAVPPKAESKAVPPKAGSKAAPKAESKAVPPEASIVQSKTPLKRWYDYELESEKYPLPLPLPLI